MTMFSDLSREELELVLDELDGVPKNLVRHVYESGIVRVKELSEKFAEELPTLDGGILVVIGNLNGKLWKKFRIAVYPSEVAYAIEDSAYSIGKVT